MRSRPGRWVLACVLKGPPEYAVYGSECEPPMRACSERTLEIRPPLLRFCCAASHVFCAATRGDARAALARHPCCLSSVAVLEKQTHLAAGFTPDGSVDGPPTMSTVVDICSNSRVALPVPCLLVATQSAQGAPMLRHTPHTHAPIRKSVTGRPGARLPTTHRESGCRDRYKPSKTLSDICATVVVQ